jgi:hypothetical protein
MISTGDPILDSHLGGGYHPGALHVLAGGVGSGKTTWLRRAIRQAEAEGKWVHVVDLEGTIRDIIPELVDLLIIDGIQQHPVSQAIPRLSRLRHPVKLLTWQSPRGESDHRLPLGLGYSADVVLHLDRTEGNLRVQLQKNRFGGHGFTWHCTLPEFQVIHRPTIWERLLES